MDLSIEHLKSGLSINTHIGCPLGCKYCVLDSLESFPKSPVYIKSAKDLVDSLYSGGVVYLPNLTPLYVNNRTDPFLPSVIDSTYDVLSELENRNCASPILLITKMSPDSRITHFCNRLNLLIFYSFANLPGWDYNSDPQILKNNLRKLVEYIPRKNLFHYYRPIIPRVNDHYDSLVQVMEEVGRFFRATCFGGIRITRCNQDLIGITKYDKKHKYLQDNVNQTIKSLSSNTDTIVFRHTSCVISYFMGRRNPFGYFNNETHCFGKQCVNYHLCNCDISYLDIGILENSIQKITNTSFSVNNKRIVFDGPVSQEAIACIRNAFGLDIVANQIILCPSEQMITS